MMAAMKTVIAAVLVMSCVPSPEACGRELNEEQFREVQRAIQRELLDGGLSWARWCYPFGDGGTACAEVEFEAR